jgi:hypothetical protein
METGLGVRPTSFVAWSGQHRLHMMQRPIQQPEPFPWPAQHPPPPPPTQPPPLRLPPRLLPPSPLQRASGQAAQRHSLSLLAQVPGAGRAAHRGPGRGAAAGGWLLLSLLLLRQLSSPALHLTPTAARHPPPAAAAPPALLPPPASPPLQGGQGQHLYNTDNEPLFRQEVRPHPPAWATTPHLCMPALPKDAYCPSAARCEDACVCPWYAPARPLRAPCPTHCRLSSTTCLG